MKKRTTALLAIAMVLSILGGFAVTANAVEYATTTIAVGNMDTDSTVYTAVSNANSSNTAVATVAVSGSGSAYTVQITGVAVGTATVTYSAIASGGNWTDYSVTVNVTASTANTTALAAQTIGIGATYNTLSYSNVSSVTTSNAAIATAAADSLGRVVVTGVSAGTATISFNHVENGITLGKTLAVTVSANASSAETLSLTVGGTSNSVYYDVSSVNSTNTSVATVVTTNIGTGQNQVTITGVAAGTATVTINYKETASSANTTRTITVTVGGGATTSTGTASEATTTVTTVDTPTVASSKIPGNSATEGIYIPKTKVAGKVGKTYRIPNLKLDGKTVAASTLRWVAADSSVIQVNTKTGVFKCLKAGSTLLFAVDINGKYMNYVTVTVS